ncbi:hypothetical protein A5823_002836 [Enterococcus faecalis]|uniref:hypothetical protein n=1 Tax=Enterococcus faecalis TaxID=1351 RepID=UPI000A33374D|nr:hypothetical protein [Enterococcus faecalis]OTP25080.1 hypothetical protein A5823_002836 [Enterococcus faecalis]
MKKILLIHPIFIFLIFVFVARLVANIQHYRQTFVSTSSLEVSILGTIVIIVLLSVAYGIFIGYFYRNKNGKD